MAQHMIALVSEMPGFLGVESVRSADGLGITVSYWESENVIRKGAFRTQSCARPGKKVWSTEYVLRVAKVE